MYVKVNQKNQRDSHWSKYTASFFTVWKETTYKPSKVSTAKSPVCVISTASSDVFIACGNWMTWFFMKVYRYPEVLLYEDISTF